MHKFWSAFAVAALVISPAGAQQQFNNGVPTQAVTPQGGLFATNGVQGCGSNGNPVATLTSSSSTASLTCVGAGSYEVRIIPTSGSPLVGTVTSADLDQPAAPSTRTLYKNGVGALEVAADTLTGGTAPLTYRTCGGNNLTIGLSSYTSGSAAVYITGSFATTLACLNGSIDTRPDRAVRNGKAFSAFVGGTVTAGQYESLYINNPLPAAGAVGTRIILSGRDVACNNPTATTAPQGYSITFSQANPITAASTPATTVTVQRRGGNNAATSAAQVFSTLSSTSFPDTATSTPLANRATFFAPTGGIKGGPGAVPRLLDPGMGTAITIQAVGTGVTGATNPVCVIDFIWEEESVN